MMEKFQQRFVDEAIEYFDSLESNLLSLEQDPTNQSLIGEVFRIMHSLKGSGAMFGFDLLSSVTHDLESLYELVRNGDLPLNSSILSFTLQAVDVLGELLTLDVSADKDELGAKLKAEIQTLIAGEQQVGFSSERKGDLKRQETKIVQKRNYKIYFEPSEKILENGTNPLYLLDEMNTLGDCTVEVDLTRLPGFNDLNTEKCFASWTINMVTDADLSEIEDVFLFVMDDSKIEIIEVSDSSDSVEEVPLEEKSDILINTPVETEAFLKEDKTTIVPKKEVVEQPLSTIRVSSSKIDEYMNLVSEMITAQSRFADTAEIVGDKDLSALAEHFNKLIRQMRDNAFDMSLVPLYNLATRFKRLVRDLSSSLGKEVVLVTSGFETEIDKKMIDKLADPIMHIIRNCIDHGIESAEDRLAQGKPSAGTVTVRASYVGTFVQIEIEDDGKGIDIDEIRERAVVKGLCLKNEPVDEYSLVKLIFEPGFTTAKMLTGVSGRGVGMDAAKKMVKELRGEIDIRTKKGEGTCFTIQMPLTLSIIDGLLTKVNDDLYIVPSFNIEKVFALKVGENHNPRGIRQVAVFDGREIPYLNLRNEFDANSETLHQQYLIAVRHEHSIFGLVVDDVLRECQAVVKPVSGIMSNHDIFQGASILGDGKVTFVLDTKKIIQKFSE